MTSAERAACRSRTRRPSVVLAALLALTGAVAQAQSFGSTPAGPAAQPGRDDSLVVAAREAWSRRDLARLETLRGQLVRAGHPLAQWADYWALNLRLPAATPGEVEAFYARWSGSYVEDRLRNDWLLEAGKRRDWASVRRDYPRFRMNDDPQVTCYAILAEHAAGADVRERALAAWLAQRDADDGCQHLARTLLAAGALGERDVWRKVRLATEQGRAGAARAALALLGSVPGAATPWWSAPTRTLARPPASRPADPLDALALARLAAGDPQAAALRLAGGLQERLAPEWAAWAWSQVGRHAAMRLQGEAIVHFRRAEAYALRAGAVPPWSDETLQWQVRAALRDVPTDWQSVRFAVEAMSPEFAAQEAWRYWGARADLGLAATGGAGEARRLRAGRTLESLAGRMSFYGKLAAEDLGHELELPPRPAPLAAAERDAAARHLGLARGLRLMALGLRSEGVRDWNFSLRGMDDRALLAAAQLACERGVWDRCISTSDRTRGVVDVAQRFPTPFREAVTAHSARSRVDAAFVYGLIRQESRFVIDARSHVGASGLMQLMPATAKLTARRLGVPYGPGLINDRDTNLRLGTGYLRLMLDEFDGSQALAAAGYNAGPGRPRRWREGPELDPAVWAETIPFAETRDYVQKVLSNAVYYAAVLGSEAPLSLRARLGGPIGPRLAAVAEPGDATP